MSADQVVQWRVGQEYMAGVPLYIGDVHLATVFRSADADASDSARLMAAAPALLDALRTIAAAPTIGGISAGERKGLERAAVIARAAIAKAEGK